MPTPERVRLFFGLPLPQNLAAEIASLRSRTRGHEPPGLRFIAEQNLHVTLKFMGWLASERVVDLREALAAIAARFAPITARAAALDAFPRLSRARVVVVRFEHDGEQIAALADELERVAEGHGVARETRPFKAHATFARLSSPRDVRTLLERARFTPRDCTFERVSLFQSSLFAGGSVYTELSGRELGG